VEPFGTLLRRFVGELEVAMAGVLPSVSCFVVKRAV
jgi:hypothetical protein